MRNHTTSVPGTSNSTIRWICDLEEEKPKMKFLAICMFALVATSSAGKTKRGIFGSPQADAANGIGFSGGQGYSGAGHNFNSAGQSYSNAGQDFGGAIQSHSNAGQDFSGISQSYSNVGQDFSSPGQDFSRTGQGFSSAGQGFSDAGSFNNQKPESIQTQHSESTENQKYPVEVQRTIVKTVHVENPVPQPYEVIKTVPQPYPVERVRSIVKEVRVSQPYPVYKDVVKRVNVERIIPKPYPVEKVVRVPVERHVPVYIDRQQQQQQGQGSYQQGSYQQGSYQNSGYQAPSHNTVAQAPSSTYGVPQSHPGY